MTPPYTTRAGLKIGLLYIPVQRPSYDRDALRLQEALLAAASSHERTSRWCCMADNIFVGLGAIALLAAPFLLPWLVKMFA